MLITVIGKLASLSWGCGCVLRCGNVQRNVRGGIAPVVVVVMTGLCCVWVHVLTEQWENQPYLPIFATSLLQAKNTAKWMFKS